MGMESFAEGFFAMVFSATGDTIKTEEEAKRHFQTSIIPTPREISKSCGLAIRFTKPDEQELKAFFEQRNVPCALYFLSERNEQGQRIARQLGEKM